MATHTPVTFEARNIHNSHEHRELDQIHGSVYSRSLAFHLYSLYLFTFSDLKTIVGPTALFGIFISLAASVFKLSSNPPTRWILHRAHVVVFWVWINLLPFAIDNQRQPAAILEDSLNKPWRPMPTRRLTPSQAKYLMLTLYPVALWTSVYLGGMRQCIALMLLGFLYNDSGGADFCFLRNIINACGFICFTSGSMEVAIGYHLPWNLTLAHWFSIIGAVIFSTIQVQDLADQAGDEFCGRRTVPLVIGDGWSRWSIALPMGFWCWFCPWFWDLHATGYVMPWMLGCTVIVRMFTKRAVGDDKFTFRIYNLWLLALYILPLVKTWNLTRSFTDASSNVLEFFSNLMTWSRTAEVAESDSSLIWTRLRKLAQRLSIHCNSDRSPEAIERSWFFEAGRFSRLV